MIVTTHAERRIRQRLGLPRRAVGRAVRRVLSEGRRREELRGELRRYLDELVLEGDGSPRVFAGAVWIFARDGALLTVWPLPGRFNR